CELRNRAHSSNRDSGGAGRRGGDPATVTPMRRISAAGCRTGGTRSGARRHAAINAPAATTTSVIRIANARQRASRRRLGSPRSPGGATDGAAGAATCRATEGGGMTRGVRTGAGAVAGAGGDAGVGVGAETEPRGRLAAGGRRKPKSGPADGGG